MAFKRSFTAVKSSKRPTQPEYAMTQKQIIPKKSVVQVYFADCNRTLAYYNDQFDLQRGDIVYVDGKLEGLRGRITQVNYNFKIKLSDYKRVIAVADTRIDGRLYLAGSHFVTFNRKTLPRSQVITWFKAPAKEDEEFASGSDDTVFHLDNLSDMNVSSAIAARGQEYYIDNKVRYLCIDAGHGYAIVEGREAYEVEFEYRKGEISGLVCSCFCTYNCKHEVAVMLQLRETLELIVKQYAREFNRSGFFAAINKQTLFSFAIDGKQTGSIML